MIVLDTATWIWLASEPERLSGPARSAIGAEETVLVSAISVWEVAMLVAGRRIELDRPVEAWVDAALGLPKLALASLAPSVAIRSTKLPGSFHVDPADRILVATALEHDARLVTPDSRIRDYPHVQTVW